MYDVAVKCPTWGSFFFSSTMLTCNAPVTDTAFRRPHIMLRNVANLPTPLHGHLMETLDEDSPIDVPFHPTLSNNRDADFEKNSL